MFLEPKESILNLDAYKPNFGSSNLKKLIRLSANENALGYSPRIDKELKIKNFNRYPPQHSEELIKTISKINNLDQTKLILGNGSDDLISVIAQTFLKPGDEAIYTEYGFLQFPQSITVAGGIKKIAKDINFCVSVDNILNLITDKTRLIFLANANNPTGTFISKSEVYRLINNIPENVLLVYDAAYAEFIRNDDYIDGSELVEKYNNVIMLRTFSKLHGLAGLRLGWGYSDSKIINYLMAVRGPFSVNSIAIEAGIIAMEDIDFQNYCFDFNIKSMKFMEIELHNLGVKFIKSSTNFILINLSDKDKLSAQNAVLFFKKNGVLVREMNVYNLPNYIRVSLGTEEENKYFLKLLKKFIMQNDN